MPNIFNLFLIFFFIYKKLVPRGGIKNNEGWKIKVHILGQELSLFMSHTQSKNIIR